LNRTVAVTSHGGQLPAAPPVVQTQQSLLFPSLLKRIDPDRRLTIFEIGPALPETIAYFSQFRCRLHFASMFSDPLLDRQFDGSSEKELTDQLIHALAIPKSTRFDVCLFWDFLNYLDDRVLRAFDAAIRPHIHASTRAHAFTLRTLDTSLSNQQYGIEQPHMFRIRPRNGVQKHCFPKTQATLVNLLQCFDINQGMLLPDGRLEVLMSANREKL